MDLNLKTNKATLYNLLVKARPNETFNFGTCKQILSFTVSEEKYVVLCYESLVQGMMNSYTYDSVVS